MNRPGLSDFGKVLPECGSRHFIPDLIKSLVGIRRVKQVSNHSTHFMSSFAHADMQMLFFTFVSEGLPFDPTGTFPDITRWHEFELLIEGGILSLVRVTCV